MRETIRKSTIASDRFVDVAVRDIKSGKEKKGMEYARETRFSASSGFSILRTPSFTARSREPRSVLSEFKLNLERTAKIN